MEFLLKQRLVGAVVLVALGVIFIPMLLEGPDRNQVPEMEALPELYDTDKMQPLESFPAADDLPDEPELSVLVESPEQVPEGSSESAQVEVADEGAVAPIPPVAEVPPKTAEPGPLGNWVVQVGSFSDQQKAVTLRDKLRNGGFATQVEKVRVEGKTFFRVRVGPYLERAEAEQIQKRVDDKFKLGTRVLSNP